MRWRARDARAPAARPAPSFAHARSAPRRRPQRSAGEVP